MRWPRYLHTLLLTAVLLLGPPVMAAAQNGSPDEVYRELSVALGEAAERYEAGDRDEAKGIVEDAFFDQYGRIETRIRNTLSASRDAALEHQFNTIRRSMADGMAAIEVLALIDALDGDLRAVAEDLLASAAERPAVAVDPAAALAASDPYWQPVAEQIFEDLAEALAAYGEGDVARAAARIRDAQYSGYKNSLMEAAVRTNVSQAEDAAINSGLRRLVTAMQAGAPVAEVAGVVDDVRGRIAGVLPDLPVPERARVDNAAQSASARERWREAAAALDRGLARLEAGPGAVAAAQALYFEEYVDSGLEAAVGERAPALQAAIGQRWTDLVEGLAQPAMAGTALEAETEMLRAGLAQALEAALAPPDSLGRRLRQYGPVVAGLLVLSLGVVPLARRLSRRRSGEAAS